MRSIRIIIFSVVFCSLISAQNIGKWKIYSAMNQVSGAVYSQDKLWAATLGGAFSYNPSDTSYSIFTKADGFNSQALSAINVDANNKIWFGSQEGYINVIDPSDNSVSKIIDIYNSNISQKQINNIFIKSDTAFISCDFGLSLLNTSNLSFYDTFMKLGSFTAGSAVLSSYKSSLVFAVTSDGVAVQKAGAQNLSAPESWNNYYFQSDIPVTSGTKIISYNGKILLATSAGIYSFENSVWQLFNLAGENVVDMTVSGSTLYIATAIRLYKYENSTLTKLYENSKLNINSITVGANQAIYLSSNNGIVQYLNDSVKTVYPNGPANNSFLNLSVDPLGRLWVATGKDATGAGFFEYDGDKWTVYNTSTYPQLPSNSYFNVYAGTDTAVYLSNWGSGITILKNNSIKNYNSSNSPLIGIAANASFISISDIKKDSKGNVWILNNETTSQKPLSVLTTDNKWYGYVFSNPVIGADPTGELVVDQYDTKWFSIIDNHRGLYYFNENSTFSNLSDDFQGVVPSNYLNSDLISALAVDNRGYIWVGTNLGLNVISSPTNPQSVNSVRNVYALSNQPVTCIAVDPLDQKWVGTTQGVIVLEPDGYQVVAQYNSSNSPLPGDNITSIAFDNKNGIVYIGTDYGLASLQTASVEPKESFGDLFIYPNPFIISGGESKSITIDGLIRNTSIKIFGISGKLVRDFDSPGGRVAFWDGRDSNGNLVPTGIYIIVAYDSDATNVKTSKVAVIRK